jgi:ADP-heptose:LPS heptosyltransferase
VILVSPWSRKTTEGGPNPKNYPHWDEVVRGLSAAGHPAHQVSTAGEPAVPGCRLRSDDLPLKALANLIRDCAAWVAVDNFFHHLAWSVGRRGVVIFGPSDPEIFGHPENMNLLKSRRFLRARQFGLWSQVAPDPAAFVSPEEVVHAVRLLAPQQP